jgi:hypothetical protein
MLPREGTIVQGCKSGACITDHCGRYSNILNLVEEGSVGEQNKLLLEGITFRIMKRQATG